MAELLTRSAQRDGDGIALLDGDRAVTWRALEADVDDLARGLSGLGLVAGNRVGIMLPNSIEMVTTYLAALRAGLVAVPVNPQFTPGEVAGVLADAGARVCVTDDAGAPTVRAALASLAARPTGERQVGLPKIVVSGEPVQGELAYADLPRSGRPVLSPQDPESLAVLLYTSGTSGRPRAAMLSHRALLANIEQCSQTVPAPMRGDDVVLGVLPLFHVYGLNAVLGQVLWQGSTLVLGRRFDPAETLSLIEARGVTLVPIAPPVIVAWSARATEVAARLTTVRTLLSGAATLAAEVVRTFEERTGVAVEQGYGLTEAAPVVTSTIGTAAHKPGSCGRALPGIELRIVNDAGEDVEADDAGEVWVRGDNLFSGYWPDGDGAPGEGGWLQTGDIGFLDPDGDLFMVDRLKELVIVSGFNVYPSEIEDVISEVEGVGECAVIGRPDEASGEVVVAYVVPSPGAPADLADRVRMHCATRLARFKQPAAVEVVDRLPHSAPGKVAKGRLRAGQARHQMGLA